ncbi:MAG: hypothetical protein NTZ17_02890 [Phycisphaerae bacterium]|nr:hypothetical protein [Phycisphaerae bacterium]
MRTFKAQCLSVSAVALLLAGCVHETLVSDTETRRPQERRPDWTYTPPPASNGKAYFVGRSLAVNVLDEKNAMNQAMDDAIYQIARAAGAEVKGSARIIDRRVGEAIRGKEQTEQPSEDQIQVDVNGTVIGVRQEDTFWERFSVREKTLGESYKRYKYYVLVSVSEEELKDLENQVKKSLNKVR